VAFLNALMDTSPEIPVLPKKKVVTPAPVAQDPATTLLEAVTSSWFLTVERMLSAQNDLLNMARQLVAQQKDGAPASHSSQPPIFSVEEFGRVFPEIASVPERMPFNVVCKGPQEFEWVDVPFEALRAIKSAFGCSFNDVALTVVAATFRRYAESRGAKTKGKSLRIVVPVNTRQTNETADGMGNQITFVPVAVPLDVREPRKLMAAVHERMTMIKHSRIAEMVSFAGALLAAIPSPLQVVLGPIAAQLPLTLCNLIFTNVPGPKQPLYVLGRKMLKAYPYVPIGGEMGVNCAMLTYNGAAHFGFSCDVHATPERHLLPKFLQESVAELQNDFGLEVAGHSKSATKRKRMSRKPRPVIAKPTEPATAGSTTAAAREEMAFASD